MCSRTMSDTHMTPADTPFRRLLRGKLAGSCSRTDAMRSIACLLLAGVACSPPASQPTTAPTAAVELPVVSPVNAHVDPTASAISDSSGSPRTTLRLKVEQTGVTVTVDGKPASADLGVVAVTPGRHVVSFSGDRYQPMEKTVTVGAGEAVDLGLVRLPVTRGMVTFSLLTPGAHVLLVHGTDRRELPMMPISVDFPADGSWVVHATLPGHCEYVRPIRFDDGIATKSLAIQLEPGCPPGTK